MLITEHDIESFLKKRVEHVGGRCLKFPAVYEEGIPDRLVIIPPGRIAFVELKRPKGGRLSEMQKYQIGKLKDMGCMVRVVKNYKDVDKLLEDMNEKPSV